MKSLIFSKSLLIAMTLTYGMMPSRSYSETVQLTPEKTSTLCIPKDYRTYRALSIESKIALILSKTLGSEDLCKDHIKKSTSVANQMTVSDRVFGKMECDLQYMGSLSIEDGDKKKSCLKNIPGSAKRSIRFERVVKVVDKVTDRFCFLLDSGEIGAFGGDSDKIRNSGFFYQDYNVGAECVRELTSLNEESTKNSNTKNSKGNGAEEAR